MRTLIVLLLLAGGVLAEDAWDAPELDQGALQALVDGFHAVAGDDGALGGDLFCDLLGRGQEFIHGHHSVDQTETVGLIGAVPSRGGQLEASLATAVAALAAAGDWADLAWMLRGIPADLRAAARDRVEVLAASAGWDEWPGAERVLAILADEE